MNTQLQQFAKQQLRDGLALLPEEWQEKFKLMYGRSNGRRSVEDTVALDMEEVITEIPEEKLDWAMTQIENSIKKLGIIP